MRGLRPLRAGRAMPGCGALLGGRVRAGAPRRGAGQVPGCCRCARVRYPSLCRLAWAAHGRLPERPKGAVCKTVGLAYVGSNPTPATTCGNSPWPASMRPGADLVSGWPCAAVCGREPPDAGGRAQYVPKFGGIGSGRSTAFPEAGWRLSSPVWRNARRVRRRSHVDASASRQAGHGPASASHRSGLLGHGQSGMHALGLSMSLAMMPICLAIKMVRVRA